jgi:hypothetical protein
MAAEDHMTAEQVRAALGTLHALQAENAALREIVDRFVHEADYQAETGEGSGRYLARLHDQVQELLGLLDEAVAAAAQGQPAVPAPRGSGVSDVHGWLTYICPNCGARYRHTYAGGTLTSVERLPHEAEE